MALLRCPLEHGAKFHRSVALRAGQRRDAVLVAIHESLNDFLLKGLAGIDYMVRDAQLLTDACGIHQPFSAAGAFATHQPQRQSLDLPACFHQQGSG